MIAFQLSLLTLFALSITVWSSVDCAAEYTSSTSLSRDIIAARKKLDECKIKLSNIKNQRDHSQSQENLDIFDDLTLKASQILKQADLLSERTADFFLLLGECQGIINSLETLFLPKSKNQNKPTSFRIAPPSSSYGQATLQTGSNPNLHRNEKVSRLHEQEEDFQDSIIGTQTHETLLLRRTKGVQKKNQASTDKDDLTLNP